MDKMIEFSKIDVCIQPQLGQTVSSDALTDMVGYARALIVGALVGVDADSTATVTLYKGQAATWASATGTSVDTATKEHVLSVGSGSVVAFSFDVDHYDIDEDNHYVGLLVETEATNIPVSAVIHRYDADYKPVDNSDINQK